MKLTLEKTDLLQLLSVALGYELKEDEVEVCADPFEVHLKTVRILDLARARKPSPPEGQATMPLSAPRPRVAAQQALDNGNLDDMLGQSAALASAGLPSMDIDPDARGINDFARSLGSGESEDPPGADYHGEIPL